MLLSSMLINFREICSKTKKRMKAHTNKDVKKILKMSNYDKVYGSCRVCAKSIACERCKKTKESMECLKSHKLWHYTNECPSWEEYANFFEFYDVE